MSIPKSVQEQADRADAILAGLQPNASPAPAPQPAPAPTPAAQQVDSNTPAPGSAPGEGAIEHRLNVLQGKYNAEVPRLHAQLSQSNAALEQANRLIEQLQQQVKAAPAEPTSLLRPEEIEEHGESLIDVIRRTAREEIGGRDARITSLETELHQLRGGVGQLRQKTFLETLSEKVPDWALINDDQQFHSWLAEVDDLSGRQRQALLNEAHQAEDGARAVAIFTAFRKTRDSWAARANDALSGQIVPGPGAAGGTPTGITNPGGRIWTKAEINAFYTSVRTGRIKGAEAAAVEAEIQLAMAENRIR